MRVIKIKEVQTTIIFTDSFYLHLSRKARRIKMNHRVHEGGQIQKKSIYKKSIYKKSIVFLYPLQ